MQWIRQDAISTDTPRNRTRTVWLDPLAGRIQSAIQQYYERQPEGEDVTMAVFDAVSVADVEPLLDAGRTMDSARRELGLRVPIELVGMFGASRVETWRREDGVTAAPRRSGRDWPRNYTPHRVRQVISDAGLSTSVAFGPTFEGQDLWRSLFESWFEVLMMYRDRGNDHGWWHNELANVSLFAGAVWRLGGVSISEYGVSRRASAQVGRADVWFHLDGHDVDIECKLAWPRTADGLASRSVEERLDDAAWQLGQHSARDRSILRFAVCFVVPALQGPASDAEVILDSVTTALLQGETALARFEPRGDPLAEMRWDGFRYPAVMMVVRRVR